MAPRCDPKSDVADGPILPGKQRDGGVITTSKQNPEAGFGAKRIILSLLSRMMF
jgi:hypothetical protein